MSLSCADDHLLVACLCAQWCGVCRDYRNRFEQVRDQVQGRYSKAQFLWIDIEDEADLLYPVDVEDFPTLLLARGPEPRFLGPLTPQVQTLLRMIDTQALNPGAAALDSAELTALVARIRAAYPTSALPAASNNPSNSTELK
ncbi:MAG: thioredoxin family protein [Rhodoferax sp.]|nr:thioredoxin family protein [Rhodoferax sp.]